MTRPSRNLVFLLAAAGALVGAGLTLPIGSYALALVDYVRSAGAVGVAVFVVAYAVATVLLLPGSVLTLAAGFVYGVAGGVAVVWVSAVLGASLAFLNGRFLARDWVQSRIERGERFSAIDQAVGRNGLKIVFLLRLSPVFPFTFLNYALGLTRVRFRDYVAASATGMLPGTLLYVYLGSTAKTAAALTSGAAVTGGPLTQVFFLAGLAATALVTVYVTRVARRALRASLSEQESIAVYASAPPQDEPAPAVQPKQ